MANRTGYPLVVEGKNEMKAVVAHFKGNTTSTPTVYDQSEIASISRSGVGTFALTFRHGYPTEQAPLVQVHGTTTTGIHARVSAWDSVAKTATIVTSKVPGIPAWTTGVAVTSHTVTLTVAGFVIAVNATAGSVAGPKQIIHTGTVADNQVKVEYAASGIATLTFDTSDAVTETAVLVAPSGPVDLATTDRVEIVFLVRNTGVNIP